MKVENLIDDLRDGKIVIVKIFGTYKKFLELIQNILNLLKIFGTSEKLFLKSLYTHGHFCGKTKNKEGEDA